MIDSTTYNQMTQKAYGLYIQGDEDGLDEMITQIYREYRDQIQEEKDNSLMEVWMLVNDLVSYPENFSYLKGGQ